MLVIRASSLQGKVSKNPSKTWRLSASWQDSNKLCYHRLLDIYVCVWCFSWWHFPTLSDVNCSSAGSGYWTLKFIISAWSNHFKAEGLVCVPPDLTVKHYTFCQYRVFVSVFVWFSEQIAIISLYSINWLVFRRARFICEKRLLGSSCVPVRPFVCMEQLGSHWTDFHEIWYWGSKYKVIPSSQTTLWFNWPPIVGS